MIARHYHQFTKHQFSRFAPSLGYLDWANQPDPFRRYAGAPRVDLPRSPLPGSVPYTALFHGHLRPSPIDDLHVGEFLRCSLGLSAWKQAGDSRWALRVNPSSGNLHPTEAYLIRDGAVGHYAPADHALETRAVLEPAAWTSFSAGRVGFLVGLTSIHWREAWKYGERAFRYCQHDTGHAIGALRLSAAMLGWRLALLPRWSHEALVALLGVEADHAEEGEEPECLVVVTPGDPTAWCEAAPAPLAAAARTAVWQGSPNRLSTGHVEWPLLHDVVRATRQPDGAPAGVREAGPGSPSGAAAGASTPSGPQGDVPARRIILQRRSAVSFDARSTLPRSAFLSMLRRLQPGAVPVPWDALGWPPQVHLALFVHRVDGLVPGVYAWLRDPAVLEEWRAAMRPEFLWENVPNDPNDSNDPNLFLLLPFDMTWPATRVSCDQEIAGDGFFSLGMIARFEASLVEYGEAFYRRLFWECGLIGQVLYLEAEAAGARATGIGCFYDDPVHEMLGLSGQAWQSLYHLAMGQPVDDPRITSEPGYPWERT